LDRKQSVITCAATNVINSGLQPKLILKPA
jgi:hypothetical protein